MSGRVKDLGGMLAGMEPDLRSGTFVFATLSPSDPRRTDAVATFREDEGLSAILPAELAEDADLPMRCITLRVNSALDGVGLTAAIATALADRGIAANVVAAHHHDHVFVQADRAEAALEILQDLQQSGSK